MTDVPPTPPRTVRIDHRFCGPPESGNGGYSAGLLAEMLQPAWGEAIEVRLHRPPPLDTPLTLVDAPSTPEAAAGNDERAIPHLEARHEDSVVLSARAVPWPEDQDQPPVVTWERAVAAQVPWAAADHPFPTCFVCGPARAPGDGLRIFAGKVDEQTEVNARQVFASPWEPDETLTSASLAGDSGDSGDAGDADPHEIAPAIVWSALDCPSGQAVSVFGNAGTAVLLGTIVARRLAPVVAGERYVLTSWEREHAGRKHLCNTRLARADTGEVLAESRSVWIAVPAS